MADDILLAAASVNQIPLDIKGNTERIIRLLSETRKEKIQLLCLPELCITGYGCEDGFLFQSIEDAAVEALLTLIPLTENMAVTFGLPYSINGKRYNCIAFVSDKKLLGLVCKIHLANDGIHYEKRWFERWPKNEIEEVQIGSHRCQAGDLTFELFGTRIGFEICEDAWVTDRNAASLHERGAKIILNPSASHFALGKRAKREEIVLSASKQYGITYVYANVLGNEAGRVIYDGDTIIAHNGEIIGDGKRFSFNDFVLTKASLKAKKEKQSALTLHEEFGYAVSLGLFDYLRKSRSHGFVISLSGGADSAATALLSSFAIKFAIEELGEKIFKEKLNYLPNFTETGYASMVKRLMTTVYQATENSSDATFQAAREIAEGIGANFHTISIDGVVKGYVELVQSIVGRKLDWSTDDIALQNIQARVRSPGIWMVANITKSLLLTTSNRSEGIVGYATMDGDMSGSLAPIAGVSKYFLKGWLRWVEKGGIREIGKFPALSKVNDLIPTAELRPHSYQQTDEKDLMPYEVLDVFERMLVEEKLSFKEMLERSLKAFTQYSAKDMTQWLEKFFELLRMSQWKRERTAPSFHLDSFNIDPRSGFRFPILSGGLK